MVRGRKRRLSFSVVISIALAGIVCATFAYRLLARPVSILDRLDISYVKVDIAGKQYHVIPELAQGSNHSEQFGSMMDRLKPFAAITGTFFDGDHKPLGDIVKNGKLVASGHQRQGIGFTSDGKIIFLERKPNSRISWKGCYSGIACGPRLVRSGSKDINVKRDGFGARAASNEAWRCAIGATADGKLILCAVKQSVTLDTLAQVMIELGARDAVNMDGGSMCALYENGKYHVQPVRNVSNILTIHKKN